MRPHSDDRQRVLDATDIVQLVGEHVTLRPKGREYVGLCPFHDDHKPSMNVVPHKGIYYCFSCNAGGDALSFVMNYHKMSFREALGYLAKRANIELTPWRGRDERPQGGVTRDAILSANLTAADFFRTILQHPEHGRAARELISRRGISPDMVQLFGLGAAPDRWDGLLQVIQKKRLPLEPFIAAGLLKTRDGGGNYDAFRNRLIFPITDQIGRVIAFGGRRLSDEKRPDGSEDAKYLNSPESAAFDKSATLFGLHQAAPEIRRQRRAIVTEGYLDTIACHQAGVTNVVATLGTALTPANARILRRQCETVVLLFDGDEAGQRAAERAVEVFFAEPVDVKIALLSTLTDAKDPDELLKREDGLDVFNQIIERAVDPLTLLMDRIRAQLAGRGIAGRARVLDEFIARLVSLGLNRVDPIRKQLILSRLATVAGVDWDTLVKAVGMREAAARPRPAPPPTTPKALTGSASSAHAAAAEADSDATPAIGLRERLLGCILCDPSLLYSLGPEDADFIAPHGYAWPPYRAVATAVAEIDEAGEAPTLAAVLASLEDPEAQRAATALASDVDRLAERDMARIHGLWNDWLTQARRRRAYESTPARNLKAGGGSDWDALVAHVEALRGLASTVGLDPAAMPAPAGPPIGRFGGLGPAPPRA